MGENLLNLVVKFTTLDGLSGSLKSMMGLGRSAKQALGDLHKEAKGLKGEMSGVAGEMSKSASASMAMMERYKALDASIANVNRRIAQQKRLMAIDARTARIQTQASAYKSAGMSGLMGAMIMAAPMMAVVHEARDYERELARIDALGLGSGVARQADKFARSAHIIGNSTRDMAHAYGDAMAIFKNTHEADFVAPLIGKMKFANQALYGEEGGGEHDQALMSLMKTIEFRGGTKSEKGFQQQADFAQKVVNASRGRVNGNEMLAAMKTGGILAKTMSDKAFYLQSEPLVQEYGGNRFGTSLSAIYSNLAQGHGSITSQQELYRLGLLDRNKVVFNKLGMLKKTLPGASDVSVLRDEGVLGYMEKVLLPAFAKKGIKGDTAIIEEFGRIFSNGRASSLMTSAYQQREKLKVQGAANAQALGIDGSVKVASNTFAGKSVDFSAKWHSFLEVAGKKGGLMDMAISGMGKLTSALATMTEFANRHPVRFNWIVTAITWLVGMKLALAAGKLAFGGLLGPVGQLWGLWSKYRLLGSVAAMFPTLAKGMGIARLAVLAMGRGFLTAGAWMLANPMVLLIGAVVVAVGLLGYVVYRNWDRIKAAFGAGMAFVRGKLTGAVGWMKSLGAMMMEGLLMALNPALLAQRLLSVAKTGVTAFKNYFGIKSPSRLMMDMGGHIATGLGAGLDSHAHKPKAAMRRMATAVAGAGALALSPAASARAPSAARGGDHYEIHIHQLPGENADALAEKVMAAIARKKRGASLSSYADDF